MGGPRCPARPGPALGVSSSGSRRAQLAAHPPRPTGQWQAAGGCTDGCPHLAWGLGMDLGNRSPEDRWLYQALAQLGLFSRLQVAWSTLNFKAVEGRGSKEQA